MGYEIKTGGGFIEIRYRWLDDERKESYKEKAFIGEWDGKEDVKDEGIFFYFKDVADVERCMKEGEEDFVVTKWFWI